MAAHQRAIGRRLKRDEVITEKSLEVQPVGYFQGDGPKPGRAAIRHEAADLVAVVVDEYRSGVVQSAMAGTS